MRIFLDDRRDPPIFNRITGEMEKWDMVCRNIDEILPLVRSGQVTFISFDHDLGQGEDRDAIVVAKEIERLAAKNAIPPIDYSIHSGNVIGAGNIDAAMKSAWRFWKEHENEMV